MKVWLFINKNNNKSIDLNKVYGQANKIGCSIKTGCLVILVFGRDLRTLGFLKPITDDLISWVNIFPRKTYLRNKGCSVIKKDIHCLQKQS